MDDALGTRRFKRVRDLDAELQQGRKFQGAAADAFVERLAFEKLHHDEVLALVLIDLVDRADAGMIQRGGGARFTLKALEHRGVLRHLRGQEFDGDVAAELGVLGLVDDAHAPAAELGGDPVVRDGLADHSASSGFEWGSGDSITGGTRPRRVRGEGWGGIRNVASDVRSDTCPQGAVRVRTPAPP